jgi:hypothetical protein
VLIKVEALDHTVTCRDAVLATVDADAAVIEVLRLGGRTDCLLRARVVDVLSADTLFCRLTAAMQSLTSK